MAARQTATLIGRRLREARDRAGWSQGDLAAALGKAQTTISQWEGGRRAPGLEDLVEAARALQCGMADLLPPPAPKRPAPAIMRALVDSLELEELRSELDLFVTRAERLPALPVQLQVGSDRPVRAAQELLARSQALEPEAVGPPVDIERLANLCGVRVLSQKFGEGMSGLLIELDEGPVIGYRDGDLEGRQRFSIAHELAHHLLHHHDRFHIDLAEPVSEVGDSPLYDWRLEREANHFAANVLMPASLVRQAFQKTEAVHKLADSFGVSPLAMGYRLLDLGLRTH
jgi:Zn-dependent peptidase ImmA (M78 family)/DNA-binding XRE family transcriptional regulator